MYYKVTDLRNDPNYIRYYINWTRFLATGLGPMAALVFFNYSIFRGIRSASPVSSSSFLPLSRMILVI